MEDVEDDEASRRNPPTRMVRDASFETCDSRFA